MLRPLPIALSLALLAGAAQASPADVAAATPTIERADADWLPAMKAKDADKLAEAYADDGVFVLANGQTVVGKAAITDFYRKRLADGSRVLDGAILRDGLAEAAGGLILEWGHGGSTRVDATGKTSKSGGPYMTVWKRGADGSWRIVRNLVF